MNAHTPGPWTIKKAEFIYYIKADTDHKEVAVMYADADRSANANLIAAAPDIKDALKAITDHFADVMGGPFLGHVTFADGVEGIPTIKAARAALAKAEGR